MKILAKRKAQLNEVKESRVNNKRKKLRIALYSHDTMGLGHIRRNLLVAQSLVESCCKTDIMLIAGAKEAGAFKIPLNVDCLTLPSLCKQVNGDYKSKNLNMSLKEIIHLRANTIHAAVKSYKPDILIVDNVPKGAVGELIPTLKGLRGDTQLVLGLRDILDDPEAIKREWGLANNFDFIRDYYDAVWVYGDPAVYEPGAEYEFPPDILEKLTYTGYFDRKAKLNLFKDYKQQIDIMESIQSSFVLCLVGGGQDGSFLAEAFARTEFPDGLNGVLITGPFMPSLVKKKLHEIAEKRPDLHVFEFVAEPVFFINKADYVVAMGGYNTTSEILSFNKRALIVPRTTPRQEQFIRADRLQSLGLVKLIQPKYISPLTIAKWLGNELKSSLHIAHNIDLDGLSRIPVLVNNMLRMDSDHKEYKSLVNGK